MASRKDKLLESAQRFVLKGQLDKAIKDYQQIVALEPKELRCRQKLAELLVRGNRKDEAIVQYENIANHYADNTQLLKSIAIYKQIQRLSPDNKDIALTIASLTDKHGLTGKPMPESGQVAQPEKETAGVTGKLHTPKPAKVQPAQSAPNPETPPPLAACHNEIPLDLNYCEVSFPGANDFQPADTSSETAAAAKEPSAVDASQASQAPPTATAAPQHLAAPEVPSPWEEDVELDLDDDLPETNAGAPDIELSLDFSLPLDFGELEPAPATELSPCSGFPAPDDNSPEAASVLELEKETPLELALPEQAADFGDFGWLQEGEEVKEAIPLRGWQEIYPDCDADAAIDAEELESHYDLGIGYKEMGLYSAAIKEFSVAAANPRRRLDCLALQAICCREKGDPADAQDLLQRGLALEVLSAEERMCLSYELAYLHETAGAVDEAIRLYREVGKVDPSYHDAGRRLARLSGEEPLDIIDLEVLEGE